MKRIVFGLILSVVVGCLVGSVRARDLDGRYANSPLKPWFDHLASGKGLCCSVADGESVADPDWESKDGHYRVRLENNWIDVPDDAVITEPNRAGRTMVWPMRFDNQISIRCFMPGSMIYTEIIGSIGPCFRKWPVFDGAGTLEIAVPGVSRLPSG
jgi:hypothetical protein